MHKNPTINFTQKDQNPINYVVNVLSKEGIMSKRLKHSHCFCLQVISTMNFNYLLSIFLRHSCSSICFKIRFQMIFTQSNLFCENLMKTSLK